MNHLYRSSVLFILCCAAVVFIVLFFISAPYGKFTRAGWGPVVKSKWAWMIMEFPSPVLMTLFFLMSSQKNAARTIFLSLWLLHYIRRTFVYPFRQSGKDKPFPAVVLIMAFVFNCLNGYINGFGVFRLYNYADKWLSSWQFIAGISLFLGGFLINITSDAKLRSFRKQNAAAYIIPEGWLFSYISSPHYFGEIVEWGGWAMLTWSIPGVVFFIFTFANLFPRAIKSHIWYKNHFPDYPAGRKAIIPFIL